MNIVRYSTSDQGTYGILTCKNFWAHTLELPWLDNKSNVSCIPEGAYSTQFVTTRRRIGGIRQMYWVQDVPGRTGILIHPGTWAGSKAMGYRSSVLGCILVGKSIGVYKNQMAIFNTRKAVQELHDALDYQPTVIEIRNNYA